MTIQVAALCDAAADYQGRLSILGAFDTIYASQFPATHPQCAVALRLAFERAEEGARRLEIRFVDEDGRPILPATQATVEIAFSADATFVSRNLIINIQQLNFRQAGLYAVEVFVDGRQRCSIPLAVKRPEATEA